MRRTRQKQLLNEVADGMDGMYTAEDFYANALKRMPHIGIATVYRFLNEKKKNRQLHSYVCNKKSVYSRNANSHWHYICQICGKEQHLNIKNIDSIKNAVKGTICHFQVDITGICEDCLKKQK